MPPPVATTPLAFSIVICILAFIILLYILITRTSTNRSIKRANEQLQKYQFEIRSLRLELINQSRNASMTSIVLISEPESSARALNDERWRLEMANARRRHEALMAGRAETWRRMERIDEDDNLDVKEEQTEGRKDEGAGGDSGDLLEDIPQDRRDRKDELMDMNAPTVIESEIRESPPTRIGVKDKVQGPAPVPPHERGARISDPVTMSSTANYSMGTGDTLLNSPVDSCGIEGQFK